MTTHQADSLIELTSMSVLATVRGSIMHVSVVTSENDGDAYATKTVGEFEYQSPIGKQYMQYTDLLEEIAIQTEWFVRECRAGRVPSSR